jgi:hypothetical protein
MTKASNHAMMPTADRLMPSFESVRMSLLTLVVADLVSR